MLGKDFHELTGVRIHEASVLLRAGCFDRDTRTPYRLIGEAIRGVDPENDSTSILGASTWKATKSWI